jgi:hypothetical protein
MAEIGIVRRVAGEWNGTQGMVQLRIEADKLDHPLHASISPLDVQSLVDLLLTVSGRVGPQLPRNTASAGRTIKALPLDSVALGETDENGTVIELNIGQTALAFFLPTSVCQWLGQTLLTLAASCETTH